MKVTDKSIVGNLVVNHYSTAEIFKKYGIDFCCGGQETIEASCLKEGIDDSDKKSLISELTGFFYNDKKILDINVKELSLDELTEHIENKHHKYAETKIPVLKEYLSKIESVHGADHPELIEICKIFIEASGQLVMHMKKEELILFPYIKKMDRAYKEGIKLEIPSFGTIKNPISKMDEEHDFEGEAFKKIAALSNNYAVPSNGCNTYKIAFSMLKEFEEDLHLHIHKENNILFQKAIKLENELLN